MEAAALVGLTLLVCGVLAVLLVPREVAYTEEALIAAPVAELYDHIRFQARLMQWSAWPTETQSA